MTVEVLNTGTELLLGNTLNTHAAWLGRELFLVGLRIDRQTTVPDGPAIRAAMEESLRRCDALIVTGGLGPTSDDLTREITAELLGLDLITDEAALRSLESFFALRGRPMVDANLKQALAPAGCDVLPNPHGTAPGIYVPPRLNPLSRCAVFLLPGPPREMHPMFSAEVLPRLRALSGITTPPQSMQLRFTGVGESDFHQKADARLAAVPGLEHGYCAHIGEVELRLIGTPEAIAAGRDIAVADFREFLISDDGSNLEQTVVRVLAQQGKTVATAESCTGGLISHRLTNVPGSSEVFTHGFVTYANEAKENILGVPPSDIERFGAVSEEVARAMAEGARRVAGTDLAVAVTGIAGPGGGSVKKPVGTAWIAVASKDRPTSAQRVFHPRNRADFKQAVSQAALDALRKSLFGSDPA
jgi:nicotinamide-nucleotide amidase